jgi:hypothetical protein
MSNVSSGSLTMIVSKTMEDNSPLFLLDMTDEFREEAGVWWNTRAHPALKMLVVSAAYYEHIAHDVEHADDYLKEISGEMD